MPIAVSLRLVFLIFSIKQSDHKESVLVTKCSVTTYVSPVCQKLWFVIHFIGILLYLYEPNYDQTQIYVSIHHIHVQRLHNSMSFLFQNCIPFHKSMPCPILCHTSYAFQIQIFPHYHWFKSHCCLKDCLPMKNMFILDKFP